MTPSSSSHHRKPPASHFGVRIWGARGSLPSPLYPQELEVHIREVLHGFFEHGHKKASEIDGYLRALPTHQYGGYGGNTLCVEVRSQASQIIIDGGSGIRPLGYELMAGPCGQGSGEVHILFTHFHWDHLVGLPFFTPIFIPGNIVHVYAVQPELPEIFETIFKKPYFPVPLKSLGAKIVYHKLQPRREFHLGDIGVTPYQLDHPDPCWGFKFSRGGKTFAHCVDTEAKRVSREQLGPDLPLYQDVDLMLFDAQYTILETIEKVDWGHATASLGLDIAIREGIKKVLFMHHDPASSQEKIAAAEAQARTYYERQSREAHRSGTSFNEVLWSFAREGSSVEI